MSQEQMPEELRKIMLSYSYSKDSKYEYPIDDISFKEGFKKCYSLMSQRLKLRPISEVPTDGTPIIVCWVFNSSVLDATFCRYFENEFRNLDGDVYTGMTHFMELPEVPSE